MWWLIGAGVIGTAVAVLIRQLNRVETYPYEELFVIQESETTRAEREGELITFHWGDVRPTHLYLGTGPDSIDRERRIDVPPTETLTLDDPQPTAQTFFELHFADRDPTIIAERHIPLEGANNFRDVGGYPTEDGRRVRWGQLYRSDRHDKLTDDDLATLEKLGINLICDLRLPSEVEMMPSRIPKGAERVHLPVMEQDPIGRWRVLFNRHRLLEMFGEVYVEHIVEEGAATYARMFRLLADPDNLPAVFHCSAGKDRTGVGAALLLRMLGVPRATVIADYTLTNQAGPLLVEEVQHQLDEANVRLVTVEQLYPIIAAPPQLLEDALAHIEARYGSVEGYLTERAGLHADVLAVLRGHLLSQ